MRVRVYSNTAFVCDIVSCVFITTQGMMVHARTLTSSKKSVEYILSKEGCSMAEGMTSLLWHFISSTDIIILSHLRSFNILVNIYSASMRERNYLLFARTCVIKTTAI